MVESVVVAFGCFPRPGGAMDVPKPYRFVGVGSVDAPKPHKFIGVGAADAPKPCTLIRVETMQFIGFGGGEAVRIKSVRFRKSRWQHYFEQRPAGPGGYRSEVSDLSWIKIDVSADRGIIVRAREI